MNNVPLAPKEPQKFLFSTIEGHTLCRRILQDHFPYEPHDVQIEGLCKMLDNIDLFAILATGSGKTSFLSMYMLVLLAIQANPSLCPTASFPRNPCMLAVCPTKYLEHQMVTRPLFLWRQATTECLTQAEVMEKLGLSALVINADTLQAARQRGEDLWKKAETDPSLLFLAPEQLISPKFSALIKADGIFAVRVCAITVDEAHLLNTWGRSWRKSFLQIGLVRARFKNVVLVALSATMRIGAPFDHVCKFLGLQSGRFHLIRRSNARPETQILFRTIKSGLGGRKFPELDWVLHEKRKTIIFCQTIHLGWRVWAYMVNNSGSPSAKDKIRLYNSLNAAEFNEQTRMMMEIDPDCLVVIGTDTLSVGVDLSKVRDVIIIGEPEDMDDMFQKFGRAGRDREVVTDPRAIIYLPAGAEERAKRIAEAKDTSEKGKLRKGDNMDISIARMVLAKCKEDEQDRQYGNQCDEDPCTCTACRTHPRPSKILPCNCSGCQPEPINLEPPRPKGIVSEAVSRIPRLKRLSKVMRVLGKQHLEQYRLSLWDAADEKTSGFTPLVSYLPLDDIQIILDSFALLFNDEQLELTEVRHLLGHNGNILDNLVGFFAIIRTMDAAFEPIRIANVEKARAGRAAAAAKKSQAKKADAARLTGIVLQVNLRTWTVSRRSEPQDDTSTHLGDSAA